MTNPSNRSTSTAGRWLMPIIWIAVGVLVSYVLLVDPLAMHTADSWLLERLGAPAEQDAHHAEEAVELWTCPMHPHLLEEEPGECPICGMTLVRRGGTQMESSEREVLFYRNPMDPSVTSPVPAQDPMGMDYVPVYADEAVSSDGGLTLSASVIQRMNVQTATATRRDLGHEIRTVGYLEYDQERMVTVTTKYSGWVEKVYVNYVGEPVSQGQALFEIYSPELVQTEQELLSAIEYAKAFEMEEEEVQRRARGLVEAARTRLTYWDISPQQIDELERTGEIFRTLKVVAPAGGLVMKRMRGLEGMAVQPGMETYHIADLSTLWLSVEIFEDQVAWISEGTPAEVRFTYFPGKTFKGMVRFIEPEFSEQTRTLRVKIEIPNSDGQLRAGMFATVIFEPIGARQALTVPSPAVLRTGQRNVVVVALGEGRFAPREVVLGSQEQGYVEILEGLEEGETVLTSAQFLIDSEASLQEAIRRMMNEQNGGGKRSDAE